MSARLVGEVANWLTTPVAAPLTPAERLVLVLIAERANEKTRDMWRHAADTETLAERLARCTGLTSKSLGDALSRLASRGLEVRVPIGTDKRGRTVFATRGRATSFRLPELPASVSLPGSECSGSDRTIPVDKGVENPVDNPSDGGPAEGERSGCDRTILGNGPVETGAFPSNGPVETGPYPYKSFPSPAHLPIEAASPPPSRAEVEVPPRAGQEDEPRISSTSSGCPGCGALLDPDGSCFVCHLPARKEIPA